MPNKPPEPVSLSDLGIAPPPKPNETERPITPSAPHFLTQEELLQNIEGANSGQLENCLKVLNFYSFIEFDNDKILFWMKRAAELGDSAEQRNLASRYLQERKLEEAKVWAEKSAQNNDVEAKKLLGRIEEIIKSQ